MTIVVAVDRSPEQERIVEEAASLGDAFGEEVHVVHVLNRADFLELETTSVQESGKPVDMDEIKRIATDIARNSVENVDGPFTPIGLVGDVASEIANHAEDVDARYLVVGGRKRSPAGKAIFGSITQSVLLNANRPVVTIIDDGSDAAD